MWCAFRWRRLDNVVCLRAGETFGFVADRVGFDDYVVDVEWSPTDEGVDRAFSGFDFVDLSFLACCAGVLVAFVVARVGRDDLVEDGERTDDEVGRAVLLDDFDVDALVRVDVVGGDGSVSV